MKIGNTTIRDTQIVSYIDYGYNRVELKKYKDIIKTGFWFWKKEKVIERCRICDEKIDTDGTCCNGNCDTNDDYDVLLIEYGKEDIRDVCFSSEDLTRSEYDEIIKKLEALNL